MLITRFLSVGTLNSVVGYGLIFFFMYAMGLSPAVSNALGYLIGLGVSYLLHRDFTFKAAPKQRGRVAKFLGVFILSYLANLVTLLVLIDSLGGHKGLSQVMAGVVYVLVSFFLSKHYVFKQV